MLRVIIGVINYVSGIKYILKKTIVILLLSFWTCLGISQAVEVRSYIGATYYQGDLSPLPNALSFSKGHLAGGSSVGLILNPYISVHTKVIIGTLSGDDAEASSVGRRRRNLSFESNLYEWGVSTELSLNGLIKGLNKFGVNIYFTGGVNLFHFNPKTKYQDTWYALQPLGTEGQGLLPGKFKYALTEVSLAHGMGVKFNLSPMVVMGFEVAPRRTFTDYIDDVSTEYVNYNELLEGAGALSAALSNRTGEYLESSPVQVNTGSGRGDPNDKDWYLFTGMFIGYRFGAPVVPKIPVPTIDANGLKTQN